MPLLTRDQVKSIVEQALTTVADFPADDENAPFAQMQPEHQKVFLTALKDDLNAYPYQYPPDTDQDGRYYDVPLSEEIFATWTVVKDCIDYVNDNQSVVQP